MYKTGEWWGLLQLHLDYTGERHLLKLLLHWYKPDTGRELPEWLFDETINLS